MLSIAGTAVAADVTSWLINPGFEIGDTTGWTEDITNGGNIYVVSSWDSFTAQNGHYFAVLRPDTIDDPTTLSQDVTVSAGDVISGWAFFDNLETNPSTYNDWAEIVIIDSSAVETQVFYANAVGGDTGWQVWSHTFTASGTYTIEARVANAGDSAVNSPLGLDLADLMPDVTTSILTGPLEVDINTLATWTLNVEICPYMDEDIEDLVIQGGIGSDLIVTMVAGESVPAPTAWISNPDKKWEVYWEHSTLDITLRTNLKGNKASATVITWMAGNFDAGSGCEDINVTFETGLNPKDKQEFTSYEMDHELDGGFLATFWYDGMEYESQDTNPQTVDIVEP
jgi:hypothetical protein